jgi:hypothetical protein
VGDFVDYRIEFYDNYRIGNPEAVKDYLPMFVSLVDICATSSRIWNAVICVEMVARSKKAVRRSTRTSDNSLILSPGPSPIFFNVRFPENSMFTKAHETDEDDVQNCGSFAYDWIKSQQVPTSCSI